MTWSNLVSFSVVSSVLTEFLLGAPCCSWDQRKSPLRELAVPWQRQPCQHVWVIVHAGCTGRFRGGPKKI